MRRRGGGGKHTLFLSFLVDLRPQVCAGCCVSGASAGPPTTCVVVFWAPCVPAAVAGTGRGVCVRKRARQRGPALGGVGTTARLPACPPLPPRARSEHSPYKADSGVPAHAASVAGACLHLFPTPTPTSTSHPPHLARPPLPTAGRLCLERYTRPALVVCCGCVRRPRGIGSACRVWAADPQGPRQGPSILWHP